MPNEQKDVRVRFSAEGIAEVVSAFQKVSSEGKKSAKETGQAFEFLNEQFAEVGKGLLAGLSIVYAADKLKELFKESLENAEALSRLSAQTGLSTAAIQAFARAALESGVGAEAANAGIQRFTAAVGKAEIGSKQTQSALSDLHIDIKSFANLSADEKLELVAQKLAAIPDPARRARDEMALFGKTGIELDQALVTIGTEGVEVFIDKLRELGIFLDNDTIRKLKDAKEQLQDLSDQGKGLGTQFLVGLIPALGQLSGQMASAGTGMSNLRDAGAILGTGLKTLILTLEIAGRAIEAFFNLAMRDFRSLIKIQDDLSNKKYKDALYDAFVAPFANIAKEAKATYEDVVKGAVDMFRPLPSDMKVNAAVPGVPSGDTSGQDAANRARIELIKARLDNELKLFEAHDRLLLAEAKASYEAGQTSLEEYFAQRAKILNDEFDKQIAIAKAKLKAEESLPVGLNDEAGRLQKATKEEQLRGQIAELNAQREAALQQDRNDLHQQELQLDERKVTAEEKLLQIEGKRTEAARLKLKFEADSLDRQLAAVGVSPDQRQAAKSTFLTQGGAAIDFQDASDKAKADLALLDAQKKSIQDQVNSGQIFAIQGEERLQELDRQRLPLLQQDAQAMLDFANTTKDPQLIASAEAFKEKIQQIGVGIDQSSKYMKELRTGIEQSVGAGFNTFLTDAIINSKSLGEAFHNAAKTMLTDLARMAIQIEEEQFLRALFGGKGGFLSIFGFGGGGGGGAGLTSDLGLGGGGGGAVFAASGGYVRGPGSTTSDSIPAMLSDQEYIVSANATRRPGVLRLLDAINGGLRVPQFASGGYVSSVGSSFSPKSFGVGSSIEFHIPPEAINMTLRDWFEREIAHNMATR